MPQKEWELTFVAMTNVTTFWMQHPELDLTFIIALADMIGSNNLDKVPEETIPMLRIALMN